MLQISKQVSLLKYNTFGIESKASNIIEVATSQEVVDALKWAKKQEVNPIILGGGSNVLFTKPVYPLVIANRLLGIYILGEDEDSVSIKCGAGVLWHDLVLYCIDKDWGGIENLSLIPGTVGAAPMQNIGAYGVEIKEVFESLEAIDMETFEVRSFSNAECHFGYRESVFKKELKGKYFIASVVLKLSKHHQVNTSYGAIGNVLDENRISNPTIKQVSDAVVQIRQSKLPNPEEIGNAGSFFKNPVIAWSQFEKLKKDYPKVPSYNQPNGDVKIPAGWLIEQCGWKGKKEGGIGVHKNQALVLVNYGSGKGSDIWDLALRVKDSVQNKFDISINPEVNVL